MPPDGQHATIAAAGDSYLLTTPGGVGFAYARDASRPDLHRIARIADRFGNALVFEYADDRLHRIRVNHSDRLVNLRYDGFGRISVVRDFTGRRWSYRYDDLGDLVSVTTPPLPAFPGGTATRYEYSTGTAAGPAGHNLLRIFDGAGRLQMDNTYGDSPGELDFNRVVRQRGGGRGESLLAYERVVNIFENDYTDAERQAVRTTLVAPDGHWTRRVYNNRGNMLLKEEDATAVLRWRYRYNADGALVATLSPQGRLTQYHFGRDDFLRAEQATDDTVAATRAHRSPSAGVRQHPRDRTPGDAVPARRPRADGCRLGRRLSHPLRTGPDDVIVKWTLDWDYQQPLAVSRTHGTHARPIRGRRVRRLPPDAGQVLNTPGRPATRTCCPRSCAVRLSRAPTGPDRSGDRGALRRSRPAGRLLRHVDAAGTITVSVYFGPRDGVREGFLRAQITDPDGLAVRTEYEVNDAGMVTAIRRPRVAGDPPDACTTRLTVHALHRVVSMRSPAPFGYVTRSRYDAGGLLERTERELRDENGRPLHGGWEVALRRYDATGLVAEFDRRHRSGQSAGDPLRLRRRWPAGPHDEPAGHPHHPDVQSTRPGNRGDPGRVHGRFVEPSHLLRRGRAPRAGRLRRGGGQPGTATNRRRAASPGSRRTAETCACWPTTRPTTC